MLFLPLSSIHQKLLSILIIGGLTLTGCADAVGPDARNVNIPTPQVANTRERAVNEGGDSIIYLPLGEDVLMPQTKKGDSLPDTIIGPFELRSETLAGALQLIMDGVDIPVAFESESSLNQTITVTNLKGPISKVVNDVCSLANMYCAYQGGVLTVKDREIFTVIVPPIVANADVPALLTNISGAIKGITGEDPISDPSTRTIVYKASQRTAEMAMRYFQRLRSNTAMIVYETYIWEVGLNSGNTMGIKWSTFAETSRFKFGINLAGAANTALGNPISIGLPTTKTGPIDFTKDDVFEFISSYGAVKTISQPQITVLSGSTAKLRVADKENYVASITKTTSTTPNGGDSFSTTTGTADTGFTLDIGSNWDNSTIYGTIDILLQEVKSIETFQAGTDATVQLPQTTERELSTSVRVRPGDMVLIAGLVRESDELSKEGLGLQSPILPSSRSVLTGNTELVFLLKPRVIVFTAANANTPRKGNVPLPEQLFTQPDMMKSDTVYMPSIDSEPIIESNPSATAIEIQPLGEVVDETGVVAKPDTKNDPSVIVNYDILGQ